MLRLAVQHAHPRRCKLKQMRVVLRDAVRRACSCASCRLCFRVCAICVRLFDLFYIYAVK